ncbi:hypothetical protein CTI12_AA123230 [Artemisia annua]|uniref:Piwi domain-containing protein n=1 Tax=Artemisia annua TaxID=35608 RepID=A0A2U1NIS2_ARTAN|nr:hypothetical protein CTI12_AA123230 [Artemisia annua]
MTSDWFLCCIFVQVVASMDSSASKYGAILCPQPPWTEIINDIGSLLKDLVAFYNQNLQRTPSRILYYRNGENDTQFQTVIETEVASVLKACKSFNIRCQPKVNCIVVEKRRHIRFFSRDTDDGNLLKGHRNLHIEHFLMGQNGLDLLKLAH